MYSKEVTAEWYDVSIPPWLRAFDCRASDQDVMPKTPWGATLFSDEKAAVDLGLRAIDAEGKRFYHDTTPLSCRTYTDARTADHHELARQVTDMVTEARKMYTEYQRVANLPYQPGTGGSVLYLPVAICLSNFGWGILCDTRTQVIRSF